MVIIIGTAFSVVVLGSMAGFNAAAVTVLQKFVNGLSGVCSFLKQPIVYNLLAAVTAVVGGAAVLTLGFLLVEALNTAGADISAPAVLFALATFALIADLASALAHEPLVILFALFYSIMSAAPAIQHSREPPGLAGQLSVAVGYGGGSFVANVVAVTAAFC